MSKQKTFREDIEKMVKSWFGEPVLVVEDQIADYIKEMLDGLRFKRKTRPRDYLKVGKVARENKIRNKLALEINQRIEEAKKKL